MIRIEFPEPDTVVWKRWRDDCRETTNTLLSDVAAGNAPEIGGLYKRKSIKDEFYFSKDGPFSGKCAYCECYITDFQHGDIEHFRPKLGVTDENDVPVSVSAADGSTRTHPGYFWLAYEWQNLLPSCTDCNQPSGIGGLKIGKHNRFPVDGQHASTPATVATERPLLINPLVEDPSDHLDVAVGTGLMTARTSRGAMCIQIFGLNVRDRLPEQRRATMDTLKAQILKLAVAADDKSRKEAKDELQLLLGGRRSYTAAARALRDRLVEDLEQALG